MGAPPPPPPPPRVTPIIFRPPPPVAYPKPPEPPKPPSPDDEKIAEARKRARDYTGPGRAASILTLSDTLAGSTMKEPGIARKRLLGW